jgi:hypothetical protein
MKSKKQSLVYRSKFLLEVFKDFVDPADTILEIGEGDGRNVKYLKKHGYLDVEGVDKLKGTPIEKIEPKSYDVIFTMSTLFLIPPENNWVFEKIAKMAKKYIITIEGEVTDYRRDLWGRNYKEVFQPFGFYEVLCQDKDVFNEYGVLRVLKRHE